MNIWRISCHGQSFPEANAADELSFNCIYSGRSPLSTVFLSAYIIYGYGFNDQHFNTAFEDTNKDVLVLTRTMKKTFLERAMDNKNWTVFYKNEEEEEEIELESYMIYKGEKYSLNDDLWDINVFSNVFLG